MRPLLTVLLPILLTSSVMAGKPAWETSELERKARVQALIKQLANESPEDRQAAYSELRDTVVRKRDIPELTKEIARNANPGVKKSLGELIPFMDKKWRLPDKKWTTDADEYDKSYEKAFDDLGFDHAGTRKTVVYNRDESGKAFADYPLQLDLTFADDPVESRTEIIDLIFTLEPESLMLWSWTDITFLGTLTNLEMLDLSFAEVTDLTLKGLPNLWHLRLEKTKMTDLTLKELPNLRDLYLQNSEVTDLSLKGLPSLKYIDLRNTKVTDLTQLKAMEGLKIIGRGKE